MRSPALSLVLVAAIVACPLWCVGGDCCCAGQNRSVAVTCSAHGTAGCCCEGRSSAPADPVDQPPCRGDDQSPCQGICGGAVWEQGSQPVDLSSSDWSPIYHHFAGDPVTQSRTAAVDRNDVWLAGVNQGRFLRTQNMSLLC